MLLNINLLELDLKSCSKSELDLETNNIVEEYN